MSLPRYGRATHDYDAKTPQQISFKKNEILAVTHEDDTHNWFRGYLQVIHHNFFVWFLKNKIKIKTLK